jgi:hypothetical protein
MLFFLERIRANIIAILPEGKDNMTRPIKGSGGFENAKRIS